MTERMIGSALAIDPPGPGFAERLRESRGHRVMVENPGHLDGPEHVITGGRQEGKTRLALRWLAEAPEGVQRVLVVLDEATAIHMKKECGWPLNDPRIVHFRSLIRQGSRRGVQYGIDDSVHILTTLLNLREMPRLLTISTAEPWQTGKGPSE
ncbi:hypothetical protein QEO77_gp02 [Arthrobacter phage Zaheer]|uniref:Uncharacterized protein n=1 Tax=Arthrobacter phage Zaheer TaxID=2836041 RepID=A0A8F3IQ25_9CAUD|nr:hypothetical protein QEO77_gp02 [Arthrobacter phage Zaheer]QWY84203.1 hypothetical protein SEA_ZAHEER_2 [Arthrobacter phage Zaheer]